MQIYSLIYMDTPLMATRNLRQVGASSLEEREDGKDSPYNYIGEKMPLNELCLKVITGVFYHTNECRFGNDFIQQLNE